jgi:hypothetical protein
MSIRAVINAQNLNHIKIHKELIEAGIKNPRVTSYPDGRFEIEVDSNEVELAQRVIANHDPTPEPPEPPTDERIKDIEAAIAYLIGNLSVR